MANKINYKGKIINYDTEFDLANQLKLDIFKVKNLIEEQTYIALNDKNKTYKFSKNDYDPVLLSREFGVQNPKEIFKKGSLSTNKAIIDESINLPYQPAHVYVTIHFSVKFSEEIKPITINSMEFNGDLMDEKLPIIEIQNWVRNEVIHWADNHGVLLIENENGRLYPITHTITSYFKKREMEVINGRMQSDEVLKLTKWQNVISNPDEHNKCVITHLIEKYPRISKKEINSLGTDKGVSIDEVIAFCKKNSIICTAFNIHEKIIVTNKVKVSLYSPLTFIYHNDHMYPIDGQFLKKKNIKKLKTFLITNPKRIMIKYINEGYEPHDIELDTRNYIEANVKQDLNIRSFICNDKKFICNDEYKISRKVLKEFGFNLNIQLFPAITISCIFNIIERLFIGKNKVKNTLSFLPNHSAFNKGGFVYKKNIEVDERKVVSIDKNKAYAYALISLPFLIVVDYRTSEIIENPTKIIDHYLYLVEPTSSTILLPERGLYAGYHIKKCEEIGIKFRIIEQISTTRVHNHYSELIPLLFEKIGKDKESIKLCKDIINKYIGRMISPQSNYCKISDIKVVKTKSDDNKATTGYFTEIDEKFCLRYSTEYKMKNFYTRLPIHCQILDKSREEIFEKIKEMKLKEENIIQVRTDSITYIGNYPKYLDAANIAGWKENTDETPFTAEINPVNRCPTSLKSISPTNKGRVRKLHTCYAGCGKTTYILTQLIPQLEKQNISYRILTPSHASLVKYNELKIPCDVIQKFTFANEIPVENYIIIDEIGFCNKEAHDLLYKLNYFGKSYEAFGDFKQLPPIDTKNPNSNDIKIYNSPQYNNFMYNEISETLTTNWRNNFPKSYYNDIFNEKLDYNEEVAKYSTKYPNQAELILCWRKKTAKIYNEKILIHKKLSKYDPSVKYICKKTDKWSMKLGLYNGKEVTITESHKDKSWVKLSDGNKIPIKMLDKYFDLGYAINIYKFQGKELTSYYWCKYDNKFLNGRVAYTIISRLKGNVYKDIDITKKSQKKVIEI